MGNQISYQISSRCKAAHALRPERMAALSMLGHDAMLSMSEAIVFSNRASATIDRAVAAGKLRRFKSGRASFYRLGDLLAWVKGEAVDVQATTCRVVDAPVAGAEVFRVQF